MNYTQFHAVWHEALDAAGLLALSLPPTETIDLQWSSRTYHIVVAPGRRPAAGPFHVTALLDWSWDAALAARTTTTEEDLLIELFGRGGYYLNTEPPWLRVSVTLHATLLPDHLRPLPAPGDWARWAAAVAERLTPLLPITGEEDEYGLRVHSSRREPEASVQCGSDGRLLLIGVKLAAWQGIELPRQWDDPDRESDADVDLELAEFLDRVSTALREWEGCLVHLGLT
ncbi:MAG: hypothetical protein KKA73_12010 [Chloroflexi bacterium]|nr:hypothetical protein [Chloroflexota bacterium]MBU1748405.1 hypothetical protein [Chloroflexota bacterium]